MKLCVEEVDRVFYPDAMALCEGEPQFIAGRKTVIANPTLVVEVLSPSSEIQDRGLKSDYYRSVASIHHILLLSQDIVQVDHIERQSKHQWTITRYRELEALIPVIGAALSIRDIYDGIL